MTPLHSHCLLPLEKEPVNVFYHMLLGLGEQKDNVTVSEINRTRSPLFEECPMVRFYIFPLKVLPQLVFFIEFSLFSLS
jgi:hypothetical protein